MLKGQLKALTNYVKDFTNFTGKHLCKQSCSRKFMQYLLNFVSIFFFFFLSCLGSSQDRVAKLRITEVLISKHRDSDTSRDPCSQISFHEKANYIQMFYGPQWNLKKIPWLSCTHQKQQLNNTQTFLNHQCKQQVFENPTKCFPGPSVLFKWDGCCRVPLPAGAALTPGRTLPKKAYDGKQRLPSPQMFQIKEHLPPRQHQNLNKAESEVITPITAQKWVKHYILRSNV